MSILVQRASDGNTSTDVEKTTFLIEDGLQA